MIDKVIKILSNKSPYTGGFRGSLILVLLLLAVGIKAWAVDYSGTYFIANGNGYSSTNVANNFYLVPATNSNYESDADKPHLTTSKTGQVLNCCWRIEKSGDYYHIIHVVDGKYLTANPKYDGTTGNDVGRLRVHLETMTEPDNSNLFEIKTNSNGGYNIRHKDMGDKINNSTTTYLDPAGGNVNGTNLTNQRTMKTSGGTVNVGGGIGYWTDEPAARWRFEQVPQNNTYTYNIVDPQGNIAIKKTVTGQPAAKALSSYTDIPEDIRSSYLRDETVKFYTFSDSYSTPAELLNLLSDENKIVATPVTNNANIYVTYTTAHLSEKFLKLRGARGFNIKTDDGYIYDDNGIAYEETPSSSNNRLWYISGGDPYNVQIKNVSTDKYLVFSTAPTLTLNNEATPKFIIMSDNTSNDGYVQVELMTATGTGDNNFSKAEIKAYPFNITTNYHLIDKAGKHIVSISNVNASELALPSDWVSPLVSTYHYYSNADIQDGVYSLSGTITKLLDVGDGGDIYVNYDVNNAIDLEGTKTYMMRFSEGESFHQEDGHDGINEEGHTDYGVTTATKAVYPYNNGDFNLYVYGQEQWDAQIGSGASTRTRWLWYIKSRHYNSTDYTDFTDLTGDDADPYHVVIKSRQDHLIKVKETKDEEEVEVKYQPGSSYLQTYKPSDYASVVTNIAYENEAYNEAYPAKMPASMVNGTPTEYMILGTSLQNMKLMTYNEVEGQRRIVNSFEQYWKNNPTVENLVGENPAADNATLTGRDWHRFTSWAYSAPWGGGSKTLASGNHWYQTISMGSGEFTLEEVSLEPQVILLDQHGWEVVRVPLSDTEALHKYNSPMVEEYQWYAKADKTTGYHKYDVSDETVAHTSTSLTDVSWVPEKAPDYYVTYTVKPLYAGAYTGAATAAATQASAYLLKQGDKCAKISGSNIEGVDVPTSMKNVSTDIQWYLRPNFDIDKEMGYLYAGESGAQDAAKSKNETEQKYFEDGKNGFDPYNVQIQSRSNTNRYFTANTTEIALSSGAWTGTSSQVTLQNLSTKQTATGYDQTTLNITNSTFMIVGDGNMRLMPRFDNSKVANKSGDHPFSILAERDDDKNDEQTFWLELIREAKEISSSSEITDMNGYYLLAEGFTSSGSIGTSDNPFRGTIDGQMNTISGLSSPLVAYADGATIKNIILKNVSISSSDDNVGAIAGVAQGYSRIYNCGILPNDATFPEGTHPTVTTTGANAGGIVGKLDGDSRVINCFSYADVSAATIAAGIVGQNTYASTAEVSDGKYTKLKTAVVNCMFYGNITGGTNQYGVYGGSLINNAAATGISSYNYYSSGSTFSTTSGNPTAYNCSFPADVRYLTQVEFHRSLLNSNRELCGWWVGSEVAPSTLTTSEVQAVPKDASLMSKWVVDPNIAPYPILKPFGKYASVVNGNTGTPWVNRATANPYEGKQLGTLSVTVNSGVHSSAASHLLEIPITDMDTLHYDFGYRKIQLPYYNTVFGNPEAEEWTEKYANNYTDQVVTGWKITAVTGGTQGEFVANWESGYNFADRNCTDKDLYDVSGRVFAQGGYYYVPDGVTAITIEAYWGKAIYVRNDGNSYDRVNITTGNTGSHFQPAGTRDVLGNGQTVYTSKIRDAIDNITQKKTVYDYGIVLVGNVQESNGNNAVTVTGDDSTRGFTIMSADFDFDEEPDYCLEWQLGAGTTRNTIAPIRFDFLPVVELGIAGKLNSSKYFFSLGCFRSYGHFEVTETAFIHFGQFEFELGTRDDGPIILNGGVFDQYTRGRNGETNQHINYVIVGGHVVMPSFTPGAHIGQSYKTRHCAVNALGGDFNSFYLTGGYNENVAPLEDNPHCYIDGGRFGTIAAAYKEGISGNVTWRINHALIGEFYGGGVMSQADGATYKIVKGNIDVVIDNSIVGKYCGGPKFGNMVSGKTVTTSATGTTFNQYFGAGNGGTNYVQYANTDAVAAPYNEATWNSTVSGNYSPARYRSTALGYDANYDYEVINTSAGTQDNQVVNRCYYYSAQFATTNTGDVTSTLNNCTINTSFYGGGFLGGVTGNVNSTLNGCTVKGNVFGAGYSASAGTVSIANKDKVPPVANTSTGMIKPQTGGTSTTYYWTHDSGSTSNPITIVDDKKYFYTEVPLDNLGAVSGNVTLTINGETTTVGESVYGGGEESVVNGNTTVTITGGNVYGCVFGGGDEANVGGSTAVNLLGGTINNNVYGGGKGTLETDGEGNITGGIAATVGNANVNLNNGVADDAKGCVVKGSIFGCNNLNGSPQGDVTVHIYATQNEEATRIVNPTEGEQTAKVKGRYDLKAVYGGGNLAAYKPTEDDPANPARKATVIIDGCDRTSIKQVYGGGNAASTPATNVTVNGTYEIEEVFGGGNGKDAITINGVTKDNPGANVGFYDYSAVEDQYPTKESRQAQEFKDAYTYGSGEASVNIFGGTIHKVFGGSNTKGNVRQTAVTTLDEAEGGCGFCVDEAYGGGKSAPMDAVAELRIGCIPGLKAVYGGAEAADMNGDVELNITNGTFKRVFGGNNKSGTIRGAIKVNIEEVGCRPIIIGELYGGGNLAPYSVKGYNDDGSIKEEGADVYADPQVNLKAFTSIGSVYGGGYGASAIMVGSPTVNINEVVGTPTNYPTSGTDASTGGTFDATGYSGAEDVEVDDGHYVDIPAHVKGKIGAIGKVFGGGNAAQVKGSTTVNIGNLSTIDFQSTGAGEDPPRTGVTVVGADIRGNVYGGGDAAEVTGDASVNIGKKVEATPEPTPEPEP